VQCLSTVSTMSNLFEKYETEFKDSITALNQKLEQYKKGGDKAALKKSIDQEFDVATDIMDNMKLVIDAASAQQQKALQTRQKNCKQQLDKCRQEWDIFTAADPNRARILAGNKIVEDSSNRLDDTHRVALETEEIGTKTLSHLKADREKLVSVNDELDVIDDNVSRARTVLSAMGRRVVTNKLILAFIIFILFAAVIGIIYIRWIGSMVNKFTPSTPTPTPTPTPIPLPTPTPGFF